MNTIAGEYREVAYEGGYAIGDSDTWWTATLRFGGDEVEANGVIMHGWSPLPSEAARVRRAIEHHIESLMLRHVCETLH